MSRFTRLGVTAGVRAAVSATAVSAAIFAGGLLLTAVPAQAASAKTRCTVTAEQRAAAVDQAAAALNALKGHKPTVAEKKAFNDAVAEMVQAARDAKMSPATRAAKLAELKALKTKLETATTAEERDAVRAEIRAVTLELKAARLTGAERAELATKAKSLRAALTGKFSKADKAAAEAAVKAAKKLLECTVAPAPATS
jgi:uncharacterized coiled-coil DUF342 family protein